MAHNGPVLLIDDDPDECEVMEDILKELNIPNQLICFSNGREAFTFLEETDEQPFLILSDINMPEMGGIELRKRMNENEEMRKKSIPFVFITTTAGPPAVREAYEMSVQGFFQKGTTIQEIKEQLQEICNYWQKCKHPNNL